jgi:hypothetical protein
MQRELVVGLLDQRQTRLHRGVHDLQQVHVFATSSMAPRLIGGEELESLQRFKIATPAERKIEPENPLEHNDESAGGYVHSGRDASLTKEPRVLSTALPRNVTVAERQQVAVCEAGRSLLFRRKAPPGRAGTRRRASRLRPIPQKD